MGALENAGRVEVGVIGKPHGGRGGMRARVVATQPWTLFRPGQTVWVKAPTGKLEAFAVERAGGLGYSKPVALHLLEVKLVEQVLALHGCPLLVARADLPGLPPEGFFLFDAMGALVRDVGGQVLGKVVDFLEHRTVVNAFVLGERGKLVVPITDEGVLLSFDAGNREMLVDRRAFEE